ncbi:DinB/UmuC family translesion DNA polymerase [Azospirillum melinis]
MSCLALKTAPPTARSTAVTRSFGAPVTDWEDIRQVVAAYAARASEKLREKGLCAECVQVFMHTSPFRCGPSYSNAATVELRLQSSDAFEILTAATGAAKRIWRSGFAYSKAGVILTGLVARA